MRAFCLRSLEALESRGCRQLGAMGRRRAIRDARRAIFPGEAEESLDLSPQMHEPFGKTQFTPAMPQPSLRDGGRGLRFGFVA